MNEFTKNLLKTSATLMIISGGAAVLVGATNALTAPVIANNASEKERQQLTQVFSDKADAFIEWKEYTGEEKQSKAAEDENGTYLTDISKKIKYVTKVWTAKKTSSGKPESVTDKDTTVGYVARVYGKNGYGALDLLVGINAKDFGLSKVCIIEDSMSYKNKLEPGYIDPYNNAKDGKDKQTALANVKCGATIAATLMKNAVEEAQSVCKKEITSGIDKNAMLFGGTKEDYTEIENIPESKYVQQIYRHKDGYIFISSGKEPQFGQKYDLYIAVKNDGTLAKLYHDSKMGIPSGGNTEGADEFVDNANKNPSNYDKVVVNGATFTNDFLKEMVKEAIELVKNKSISMNSYDMDVITDTTYDQPEFVYDSAEERR